MPQSTFEQAEGRALAITAKRAEGWTQREIGEQLGISRDLVAYYLRPFCKAALRTHEPRREPMKQAKKETKTKIKTAAELPSIYVVIVPCTRTLKHWRGYHKYEKALRVAARVGGIVSSAQFLRKKFGYAKHHCAKKAA